MENLDFGKEQLAKGIYASTLPPTRTLAQIAVADIGAIAVRVLEDAGRFTGKRFDLAGGSDVVAILSRVTGLSPAGSWGTNFTGITGTQGPTRWRGGGSPPDPTASRARGGLADRVVSERGCRFLPEQADGLQALLGR